MEKCAVNAGAKWILLAEATSSSGQIYPALLAATEPDCPRGDPPLLGAGPEVLSQCRASAPN